MRNFTVVNIMLLMQLLISCTSHVDNEQMDNLKIVGGGSRMDPTYNYSFTVVGQEATIERWNKDDYSKSRSVTKKGNAGILKNNAQILLESAKEVSPPFIPGYLPPYIEYSDGSRRFYEPIDKEDIEVFEKYTNGFRTIFE